MTAMTRNATSLSIVSAVLVGLSACATVPGDIPLAISGQLTYPERIALPAHAVALAEVRAFDARGERVLAESRTALDGRQVPVPFALATRTPADALAVYEVTGAIEVDGRVIRHTESVPIAPAETPLNLGTLRLFPLTEIPFGTHFDCGDAAVVLGGDDTGPVMLTEGELIPMRHTRAASGVRLEAEADASTVLHTKGVEGWVSVGGREHTNCIMTRPPAQPFTAQGQEPPWRIEVGDGTVRLTTAYGSETRALTLLNVEQLGVRTAFRAADHSGSVRVTADRGVCRDSMSGMPHPYAVTLSGVAGVQPGCGGRPIDLLAGKEWVIEQLQVDGLHGSAPLAGSRITLRFIEGDGRIAGSGSCNRYNAGYTLDGESLRFTHAASTKMACAPELMRQEQTYHDILNGIHSFDIDDAGHLILQGSNGRLVAIPEPVDN